jgi:hypothetical protein
MKHSLIALAFLFALIAPSAHFAHAQTTCNPSDIPSDCTVAGQTCQVPSGALTGTCVSSTGATTGGLNTSYIQGYSNSIIGIINNILVPLLVAIAFIIFIWGVFKAYILSAGDSTAVSEGHQLILWGIIGFVVIFSVWGIVNIFQSTLGLSAGNVPTPPTLGTLGSGTTPASTQGITGCSGPNTPIYGTVIAGAQTITGCDANGNPIYGATPGSGSSCNGTTIGDGTPGSCCSPSAPDCDGSLVCSSTTYTCSAPSGAPSGYGQGTGTVQPGQECATDDDCADVNNEPYVCPANTGVCSDINGAGDCTDGTNDCY